MQKKSLVVGLCLGTYSASATPSWWEGSVPKNLTPAPGLSDLQLRRSVLDATSDLFNHPGYAVMPLL